jgi:hypothetical protein
MFTHTVSRVTHSTLTKVAGHRVPMTDTPVAMLSFAGGAP